MANTSSNTQFYLSIYSKNCRHLQLVTPMTHEGCFLSLAFFQCCFFGVPLLQPDVDIGVHYLLSFAESLASQAIFFVFSMHLKYQNLNFLGFFLG
jgi:hypothetical protein